MQKEILKQYDDSKSLLSDYSLKMEQLIYELLKNKKIQIHQVSSRLKERISLEKKITRKKNKYKSLHQITDIVGIRIISYLESDVNIILEILKQEFIIDKVNSIDKRKMNIDQFGYKSVHFIVKLNEAREKLIEYSRFKEIKFEIQIRSILQHAWAEIEHDLGYKGISTIPDSSKRTFNRLSALLETADIEFDRLKKELVSYEANVDELISKEPENVTIDQTSLHSLNLNNKILIKAQNIIQSNTECIFDPSINYKREINTLINFYAIRTIKELEEKISEYEKMFLLFVDEYTKLYKTDKLNIGISIFYFLHFLSAVDGDSNIETEYLKFELFTEDEEDDSRTFVDIINQITH